MQSTSGELSIALNQKYTCWVPNCTSHDQKIFPLPENPKCRELWLALAGKSVSDQDDSICFCAEHFSVSVTLVYKFINHTKAETCILAY